MKKREITIQGSCESHTKHYTKVSFVATEGRNGAWVEGHLYIFDGDARPYTDVIKDTIGRRKDSMRKATIQRLLNDLKLAKAEREAELKKAHVVLHEANEQLRDVGVANLTLEHELKEAHKALAEAEKGRTKESSDVARLYTRDLEDRLERIGTILKGVLNSDLGHE